MVETKDEAKKPLKSIGIERYDKKTGIKKTNQYVPVNIRVKEFRENPKFAGFAIRTHIVQLTDNKAVIRVEIFNKANVVVADGLALEERDNMQSLVNKTNFLENAQTSAAGRALGFLGIGIDEAIASLDEVKSAQAKQTVTKSLSANATGNTTQQYVKHCTSCAIEFKSANPNATLCLPCWRAKQNTSIN